MTSRHGLSTVISTSDANNADSLSSELEKELQRLEEIFTVDAKKLKEISQRFGEELQEGTPLFALHLCNARQLKSMQDSINMDPTSP